jgi:glycosyltransferase involved in cell wall biosynthesis
VVVTGTVPDVRPFIHHAEIAVAPLRIARGIQNKVLEAMAMGRPVIVSPQALEGIDAIAGRDLLLADGAEAFIAAVQALLAAPDASLGAAARVRVEQHYSWPSKLARIEERLECK